MICHNNVFCYDSILSNIIDIKMLFISKKKKKVILKNNDNRKNLRKKKRYMIVEQ